jgi:drug/metabolite transporter (DMT)-like permease
MGLDIRLPIGLLFSIVGTILLIFGALGDKAIYRRSLGININLGWGIILLVFGLLMLAFGCRANRREGQESGDATPGSKGDHT